MLLKEFYDNVLPATGSYCLFQTSTRRHTWVGTLESLVDATADLGSASDIYFATGTFSEPTSRSQANADLKKAFYLDLDAGTKKLATQGPEKVYADQSAALSGVVDFCRSTGLAPTLIVSSGEGLHLYWVLTDPIPAAQWTVIAKQFQKFGLGHGLKIDTSVTSDSARILRPVGTAHPNGKAVEVLRNTGKIYTAEDFAEAIGTDELDVAAAGSKYDLSINDDVVPDVVGPPKTIRKVLENCGAARHAFKNQDKIEEPYWRLMIGIAKHTVEGIDAAVACSERHPDYNARQTADYFERWATGPSTCEKFGEFNSAACAKCVHKGKIKSPIVLGALNVEEVAELPEDKQPAPAPAPKPTGDPWDGKIPKSFDVEKVKGITTLIHHFDTTKENELGEMVPVRIKVPITHEIFWLGHWSDPANPSDTAQVTVFIAQYGGRVEHFVMNQEVIASRAELSKFLAGRGIHTTTDKKALASMEEYVKKQMQRIKIADRQPKISERFGLTYLPNGDLIAVQGENAILPDGTITRCALSPALSSFHTNYNIPIPNSPDGLWDKTVWKEHIFPAAREFSKFMTKHYSERGLAEYRLAFMLNAASPLMAFTQGGYTHGSDLNASSFTVSLYSKDGGKGKTTIMNLMALTYGTLASRKDKNRMGSTELARLGELSFAGTLPVYMDEMGNVPAKAVCDLISAVANGASRVRKTRVGGIVREAPWSLINTMAANVCMREMVVSESAESNAIQYRMLELDVSHVTEHSRDEVSKFDSDFAKIVPHGGALGAVIHLQMCRMGGQAVAELLHENIREARKIINSKQIDRFQDRALGAMITVHQLMENAGLAPFALQELCDTFRVATVAADEFVEDSVMSSNGLEQLSQMLHDFTPYTTITINETRLSPQSTAHDIPINNSGRVPEDLRVRHITSSSMSYVKVSAITDWCREKKIRSSELVGAAKLAGVLRRVYPSGAGRGKDAQKQWASPFSLTKGMRENAGGQIRVYAFNIAQLYKVLGKDYGTTILKVISNPEVVEEAAVNE